MGGQAPLDVGCPAAVEAVVGAPEQVDVWHAPGFRGRAALTCRVEVARVGARSRQVPERRVGVGLRSAVACHDGEMQEIEIAGEVIRLGQLLKLSALADSGADARELLLAGGVTVNGAPEARRGRQLHRGDLVTVGDQTVRVA
jgi:ribosome-associated protein